MSRVILAPKLVSSLEKRTVDFAGLLGTDTISSGSVTVSVFSGIDPAPTALLSGGAVVVASQVTQAFTGGTAGVIYELLWKAYTATQTLVISSYLAVVPDLP